MLTLEDFDGREMKEDLNPFEVLLEVAAVASEKFEREKRLEREKKQSNSESLENCFSSPKKPRSIWYVSQPSANFSERKSGWFSDESPTEFLKREISVQEGKSVKVVEPGMRETQTDFVGKKSVRTHVTYCPNVSPDVGENSSQKDEVSGDGFVTSSIRFSCGVFKKGEELMGKHCVDVHVKDCLVGDESVRKEFVGVDCDKASLMREKLLKRPVVVDEDEDNNGKRSFKAFESELHALTFQKQKMSLGSDPTPEMLMKDGDKSSRKESAYPEFDRAKQERLMREKLLKRPVVVDEDEKNERKMSFEAVERELRALNFKKQKMSLGSHPTPNMLMKESLVGVLGDKSLRKESAYPEFDRPKHERLMREKLLKRPIESESLLDDEENKGMKRSFETVDSVKPILKFKTNKSVKSDTAESDLPQEFKQRLMELGGTNVVLVLQKKLFKTDVSKDQTRFSIPKNQVKNTFLTMDEERRIHTRDGKKWQAMEVLLMQPDLQESTLKFKIWDMKKVSGSSTSSYVIVGGWYPIVERNHLKLNDLVQLWAFRKGGELCFALVVVQRAPVEERNNSNNADGARTM